MITLKRCTGKHRGMFQAFEDGKPILTGPVGDKRPYRVSKRQAENLVIRFGATIEES